MKKVSVIGAGFSGLSAAAYLAKAGYKVDVYEKNTETGGRARQLHTANGYTFDMGPSWYWMPEIFEKFFNDFGFKSKDFYELKLLDPAFSMIFPNEEVMNIPADYNSLCKIFESKEKGSAEKLNLFLKEAAYKYKTGMDDLVYKPGNSIFEFINLHVVKGILKLQVFTSFSKHVRKYFSDPQIISLLEFPVLFLGSTPQKIPALYSLMDYAALKLGTWYPVGGFGKVAGAMKIICEKQGVNFHFDENICNIEIENKRAANLISNRRKVSCDAVLATADYHHVEKDLLKKEFRNYSDAYWESRVMAPSCLIFFLGIKKKINKLNHHNLFFDEDLIQHSHEIYINPEWPSKPLFYVCCPSKTDESVAPENHENIFMLMPIAVNLEDNETTRERYFKIMIHRVEKYTGESVLDNIDFKKSYCIKDFILDYHSYKGNAYGLANTVKQTAFLKPSMRNKKVKNLFYAGQLTVPGPGVPPAIISGNVAANQIIQFFNSEKK